MESVSIHNDIRNYVYTVQERADQGTTKARNEAYEFVRRSDETRSNEGMRSYGTVYSHVFLLTDYRNFFIVHFYDTPVDDYSNFSSFFDWLS